jgi:hypothetical protein
MARSTKKKAPSSSNRRKHERYLAIFGSAVNSEGIEARLGLTQDVSQGGARILTLAPYGIGQIIKLRIIVDDQHITDCEAKVVREKEIGNRGMWQYEIAVKFTTLLTDQVVIQFRQISEDRQF